MVLGLTVFDYFLSLSKKMSIVGSAEAGAMPAPRLLNFVKEAQILLHKETPKLIYSGKKVIGRDVPVALWDPTNGKVVVIRLQVMLEQKIWNAKEKKHVLITNVIGIEPDSFEARKAGGNGINTTFEISKNGTDFYFLGWHYIKDDASEKMVYTPYADFLATADAVKEGRKYLNRKISEALAELKKLGVRSRAYPNKLVADLPFERVLFNLALIEHMDHEEYERYGAAYMWKKVLTQFALNKENTFSYATSHVGALGLMQIMPFTYRGSCGKYNKKGKCLKYNSGILQLYPSAKLPLNPQSSSESHVLALKVAALVLDDKLTYMSEEFRRRFLREPERFGFVPAAAYNGGHKRAIDLYKKVNQPRLEEILSDLFSFFTSRRKEFREYRILRRETWIFIKKYIEIDEL